MTLMPASTAAVYYDALTVGRRFRTLTFLLLALILLAQIALFLTVRFVPEVRSAVLGQKDSTWPWDQIGYMATYASAWLGLAVSILFSLSLVYIVLVMISGRTVGAASAARAFVWSLVLVVLMVPWQAALSHPLSSGEPWRIPGVLYQWPELVANADGFAGRADWLGWIRFVGWPGFSLLLLVACWLTSGRGVRRALGANFDAEYEDEDERPTYEPV